MMINGKRSDCNYVFLWFLLPATSSFEVTSNAQAVALSGTSDGKSACSEPRSRQVVDLRV